MFACYDFNKEWNLVEMTVPTLSSKINWMRFCVPNPSQPKANWQVPYLEQYLNEAGTERICGLCDEPRPPVEPARIVFFLYKAGNARLQTPYGGFDLEPQPLPARLAEIVEFEDVD